MPTVTFSPKSLTANCDETFPNTGTYGYLTLIDGTLTTGLSYTANTTTNALTTAVAHKLVTGSKIRLVGGTLPVPLLTATDYYAIVTSATAFQLAINLDDANTATFINITTAGAGGLTFSEQPLTVDAPLAVLVNKEINHPSWPNRLLINDLGPSVIVSGKAEKPLKTFPINNADPVQVLSYQQYLLIESTSSLVATLGNVPSNVGFQLGSEASAQVINPGDPPRAIFFQLRARNV